MEHRKHQLLYLTGFMGSGKSTIAPILANTLGFHHRDIDREIEQREGKPIARIFADKGETYFRAIEQDLLRSCSLESSCVVSLGGGTITHAGNLEIIKSSGMLIYLKLDGRQIYQRVRSNKERPMLYGPDGTTLSDDQLQSRIDTLLAAREPFYNQADLILSIGNTSVGATVDRIARSLRQFLV